MGNSAAFGDVKRQCMSLTDFFGSDEVEGSSEGQQKQQVPPPPNTTKREGEHNSEAQAATKLQAAWRGKKARDTFRSLQEESGGGGEAQAAEDEGPGFSGYDAYPEPEPEPEPQYEKFDPNRHKEDHAAVQIQAIFRGRKVRKQNDLAKMKNDQLWAATKIQAAYRGHQVRQAGELSTKRNRWVHFQEDSARGIEFTRWDKGGKSSKCTVKIDWSSGKMGGKNVRSLNLSKGFQVYTGKHTDVLKQVSDSQARADTCLTVMVGKKAMDMQALNKPMRDHFAWGLGQMMLKKGWRAPH